MSDESYNLMIVTPEWTYNHLRDEGAIYAFKSGNGFVDKLDVERFGWIVQEMSGYAANEEGEREPVKASR